MHFGCKFLRHFKKKYKSDYIDLYIKMFVLMKRRFYNIKWKYDALLTKKISITIAVCKITHTKYQSTFS